jgi:hypothetical protein
VVAALAVSNDQDATIDAPSAHRAAAQPIEKPGLHDAAPIAGDSPQLLTQDKLAAAATLHRLYPSAVLDGVDRPKETDLAGGLGDGSLYWVFRFHMDDKQSEAYIAPDGLLVRKQDPVEASSLPQAVAEAISQAAANSTLKSVQRQETCAALRFVALETPKTSYAVTVEKEGKESRLTVRADAALVAEGLQRPVAQEAEEEEPTAGTSAKNPNPKEITIPEPAAKAVRAVKEVYPSAVVQDVEEVAYDDRTGHVETILYEIEFPLAGSTKTVIATPDGVILSLSRPAEVTDLPQAVVKAIAEKVPGGIIKAVIKEEERAVARFVALKESRVVYLAEVVEKGKESIVRFSPDGKKIEPFNPWGTR